MVTVRINERLSHQPWKRILLAVAFEEGLGLSALDRSTQDREAIRVRVFGGSMSNLKET